MPITDRDKRTLVIGGSVLGFLLLAFLVYTLFLSGGSDTASGPSPITTPPPAVSGSLTLTPTPTPTAAPSASGVTTFSGHDPYCIPQSYVSRQVLLHLPVDITGYYCPGVFLPTPSPSVTPTPSGSGTPTSTPSPSPSVPSSPSVSSATIGGRTVVLVTAHASLPVSSVQVEVDGKVYSVSVGHTFGGGSFQLQGVSGSCASFLYGDQAFRLCGA